MNRLVLGLAGLLMCATMAHAENYYEYIYVAILDPKTCTSPCQVEWLVELKGLPLFIVPKQCIGSASIIRDRFLTVYFSGDNLPKGRIKVLIGDNNPNGRTQTYCARLISLPLLLDNE